MNTLIGEERSMKVISTDMGFRIENLLHFHDGFSFTTQTELQAYQAAYKYQGLRVIVREAPNVSAWSVSVYRKVN